MKTVFQRLFSKRLSSKKEYQIPKPPPCFEIGIVCGVKECCHASFMPSGKLELWHLGLLPFRCEKCGTLQHNYKIESLENYMRGA